MPRGPAVRNGVTLTPTEYAQGPVGLSVEHLQSGASGGSGVPLSLKHKFTAPGQLNGALPKSHSVGKDLSVDVELCTQFPTRTQVRPHTFPSSGLGGGGSGVGVV